MSPQRRTGARLGDSFPASRKCANLRQARATGGNQVSRLRRAAQAPPADPTATRSPVAPPVRNELGDLAARRVATACESKAATAPASRRQVRSSHARAAALRSAPDLPSWSDAHLAGDVTHPARRLCGRARQARPIAVIVPAVGLAPGEGRHSGRRAGWSCFVDRAESADRRHDPVWTVLLCRAAAAARRPSRACASRPTRACRVPLGSRQLAIEA